MTALPPPGPSERRFVALFMGSHLLALVWLAIATSLP